jgi:HlyD family secretion protein
MRKNLKRAGYVGAALVVVALLALAFRPEPLTVETARAARGLLRVTIDEDGEVRAHNRYVVAAPVGGRLTRIALLEGDGVTRDQVVARLAPLPLSAREREEQTARVAAAEALRREAEERVRQAQADYEQSKRERERIERLVGNGFVSPQAAEQARIAETTKNNQTEAARFHARSAAADVRAARAVLQVSAVSPLIEVLAPVAGSVLRINEKSERVVAAGTPLLVIGDPGKYEVVIDVLSSEAVKIRRGMTMMLENWGGGSVLRARVRTVEPSAFTKVSALGVEEQRVNVVADFVDPPGPLGDGYRVEGRIVVWEKDQVLKVPASSLFRAGSGWALFEVRDGRALRREVEVGQRNAVEAEVLRGLDADVMVVRHPANALHDGARVRSADSR